MEQQYKALSGISGQEAAAQRARLKAQLQEQQDEMEDEVRSHIYELQVQGLDDLRDQLQEDLDDWMREIAQNLDKASSTITQAIATTNASRAQILNALNKLLGQFGIKNTDLTGKQYTTGFAKGTKRVNKSQSAYLMEDGREMYFTKAGILTQVKPGEAVMNNKMTEQFFEVAKNYPVMAEMFKAAQGGKLNPSVTSSQQVIAPTIECPITINGTNMSAQQVENMLNGFIPKISKTVQNDIRRDLRKSGR